LEGLEQSLGISRKQATASLQGPTSLLTRKGLQKHQKHPTRKLLVTPKRPHWHRSKPAAACCSELGCFESIDPSIQVSARKHTHSAPTFHGVDTQQHTGSTTELDPHGTLQAAAARVSSCCLHQGQLKDSFTVSIQQLVNHGRSHSSSTVHSLPYQLQCKQCSGARVDCPRDQHL